MPYVLASKIDGACDALGTRRRLAGHCKVGEEGKGSGIENAGLNIALGALLWAIGRESKKTSRRQSKVPHDDHDAKLIHAHTMHKPHYRMKRKTGTAAGAGKKQQQAQKRQQAQKVEEEAAAEGEWREGRRGGWGG